jgi:hypothetical protein
MNTRSDALERTKDDGEDDQDEGFVLAFGEKVSTERRERTKKNTE